MRAWPRPEIPVLPVLPGAVHLQDSRSGMRAPVTPDGGVARVYACGITPYDATHLGHAFTYVAIDLLNRALLDCGHGLRYVQNVTDVDDPLLERAAAIGVDWEDLALEQTDLFRSDMAALRVVPPTQLLGVVESIDQIVASLQELEIAGLLYRVDDQDYPDWYFEIAELDLAGLAVQAALETFAERGGDPARPGKQNPLDYLVWRMARPGEPAWQSPFGTGRPGWHVECTSLAVNTLGPAFDVQAGGNDLAFPHHPMCAAGATALTGEPFARSYLHTGMVGLSGEKMSKSRGNLVFFSNLVVEGFDPMAIRLALLAHHYRSDWEFTMADLTVAERRLAVWRQAVAGGAEGPAEPVVTGIRTALRDDLDAPAALALVDEWAQTARAGDRTTAGQVAVAVDALLGVWLAPPDLGRAASG